MVIDVLRDGGHEATLLEPADALLRVAHWYAAEAAAELSAEEAAVLAGRIVAAFARGGAPHAGASDRCALTIERRVTPILGAPEAARLRAQVRQALVGGGGTEGVE